MLIQARNFVPFSVSLSECIAEAARLFLASSPLVLISVCNFAYGGLSRLVLANNGTIQIGSLFRRLAVNCDRYDFSSQ